MTVIKKIAENKNIIKSAVSAAALCGFLYFENKCLTVGEYIAESMKISDENDGLCIVQISDLQNTEFGHKNKRLINKIKSLEPDIIVITGDIVDCHRTDIYSALDFAKEIGVSCITVTRWETGKAKPNLKTMRLIDNYCKKNAIDFDVCDIVEDEEKKQ